MKIYYNCECCGEFIDAIEVDHIDEVKFGFDCLTEEERQEILRLDPLTETLFVHSLCDSCIDALGLNHDRHICPPFRILH